MRFAINLFTMHFDDRVSGHRIKGTFITWQ